MSLRTYEYIAAVNKHRSFSRAAAACNVTQPTLSGQIKKMEERLGVTLFNRTTKRIELTTAGSKILDRTMAVLKIVEEINVAAETLQIEEKSSVSVGMEPCLAPFLFGHISDLSKELDPALQLKCRENIIDALIADMDNRLIDIAIVAEREDGFDYKFTPIFQERILLGVSHSHDLARRNQLKAEHIPLNELVVLRGQNLAALGLRAPSLGGCDTVTQGIENILTALHFVKGTEGCVLVPEICSQQISAIRPDIKFIALQGETFSRTIGVLSRGSYLRAAWLDSLCESIQSHRPFCTRIFA